MLRVTFRLAPPAVVTTTSAAPAAWAGVVTVIEVAVLLVRPVAAMPPMVTPVALVRLVPVMTTVVPPSVVPLVGAIDVTVGAGGDVDFSASGHNRR